MIKALFSAVYAALLLTLAAAAFAEDSPSAGSSPLPKILIFGDSLSAAYGIGEDEGWVTLLAERLAQEDSELEVVNGSVSGETTTGGRARLPSLLERYNPAFVLIELGGNDGLRGLPLSLMRENLTDMIQLSQSSGATVMIAGMQIPPNYGPRYTEPFFAQYAELAEEFDLYLIPFLIDGIPQQPELMQADGIHPKAEAQSMILDNFWPVLLEALQPSD
ncbi:arylesterase [Gammaproteobacteria bacterium]|mgnify:FL=1|jgi:acyl-CoA thioesterase-1|nr:arylesterase [Gammaproteobacteria bacterium]MBT4782503.1 arylesterase [Gammaproteobacteria bacterium]MBT5906537.1 arylesterase [Gammaproteobacteria bacterium]MBT6316434.1 arylesterase [Gammaproteobacteria bacterium]MBT6548512.1 arylesterase [Gammaproteobacteria bacterium]